MLGRETPLYCSFGDILSKSAPADTSDHSLIDGRVALADYVLLRWMFSKFGAGTGEKIGRTQRGSGA